MAEDIVRLLGYLALGTRLKRVGERMQADTQRILDAHELAIPAGQVLFLAAIDRLGPLTIGDLAQTVGVTQPGVTRAVMQLEEAGLLAVVASTGDQRQKRVSLTARGERLVSTGKREVWPAIERAVRALCQELKGSLLEQLAALEDGLEARPLHRRVAASRARRR